MLAQRRRPYFNNSPPRPYFLWQFQNKIVATPDPHFENIPPQFVYQRVFLCEQSFFGGNLAVKL